MKPKLFVPDYINYADPFKEVFDLTSSVAFADVVMFTGGADISPELYGEKMGKKTAVNRSRDEDEKRLFELSFAKGKKFLGICRGAQFLCAMAGGKLAQHVTGHGGLFHQVVLKDGSKITLNSLHHQMMLPGKVEHELIGWTEGLSSCYLDGNDSPIPEVRVEPEIVFFPKIRALGIQCHPEMAQSNPHALPYFHNLVKEKLLS